MDPNTLPEQPQYQQPAPSPVPPAQSLSAHQQFEQRNMTYIKDNPLAAMQEGEETLADIHRHPFGIVSMYIFAFLGLAAACGAIILLVPKMISANSSYSATAISIGLIGLVLLFMIIGLGITTMIYWQNRWILTSDSLTQITQKGLFSRQSSQLSLGNLEDVTAEQRGLIPNMLNFGTLKVETAGERSKFYFLYCPDPNLYARKILMARELYLQAGGSRGL